MRYTPLMNGWRAGFCSQVIRELGGAIPLTQDIEPDFCKFKGPSCSRRKGAIFNQIKLRGIGKSDF